MSCWTGRGLFAGMQITTCTRITSRRSLLGTSSQLIRFESFSTKPEITVLKKSRIHRRHPPITTLHPDKLTVTEFRELSKQKQPTFMTVEWDVRQRLTYAHHENKYQPFPPGTRGFLYYYSDPKLPSIAGELRFRITPSSDPGTFYHGNDLLRANGTPWSIRLLPIAVQHLHSGLRRLLLKDKLVTETILRVCQTLAKDHVEKLRTQLPVIYSFGQPFLIDFSKHSLRFWVVKGDRSMPVDLLYISSEFRRRLGENGKITPYTGKAYISLELSTLPQHPKNTVVFRVIKIIEPVKCVIDDYDGYMHEPREGYLLTSGWWTMSRRGVITKRPGGRVHALYLDKVKTPKMAGLRLLLPDSGS
ncbi:hypothetical protein Hypma_005772 [Hypsizygus marmoreus]|uniref:Uncharacterized protein n=1 Tax=Hypsizygus marmoreus TaxID=39966 RepID=A0A369KBJ6_HYPMA|nr:hypothetical protein Hypma_005772 [Hypsizygus marmoreus]